MEDIVRDTLKKLIAQYGIQLCYEPQRVEGFLRDYCGQYRREINVLTIAARQRVPEELLKLSDTSMGALVVHRLAQRLHDDIGMDKEFAMWAVNTWAVALSKTSSDITLPIHIKEDTTASTTIPVTSSGVDNWFTLEETIKNARSGETICLRAGIYTLTNALSIDKSLNIKGEGIDKTIVVGVAGEYVIRLEGNYKWNIQDISFEYRGTENNANILIASDGIVDIRRCSFTGAKGGAGLMLRGNITGIVMECNSWDNRVGISVQDKAHPILDGNSCQDNSLDGIQYCEQATGTARNNRCVSNGCAGIGVRGKAQPHLQGNCCQNNGNCGILYYGEQAGGTAYSNECVNNKVGISARTKTYPHLESNFCQGNSLCGIYYSEQAAGTARNNECTDNKQHGIIVWGGAHPVLEGNRCINNKFYGIYYGEQAAGIALNNECRGNSHGIKIRDKAHPMLKNNREI